MWGENTRSLQMEHTFPLRGWMPSRHSSQTGRREIFLSDTPQIRQSEGNRTAKRLAAAWVAQVRGLCKTIGATAAGTVAWPARVLSSLLLKTASLAPHGLDCSAGENTRVRTAPTEAV